MKILLINIKYLGDLIVSTPGIRALRKHDPDAQIYFLLRKGFEDVLADNPNVDKIISFDTGMKGNSGLNKIVEGIKFIKKIRDEKFDVVISLHPGDRTAFWAWFSGAKTRIAPLKQSFGFLFNRRVKVEEDSISYLDYYNRIIEEYTGHFENIKTEFYVNASDDDWAGQFLQTDFGEKNKKIIAIHPGASELTKMWPAENFIELIDRLKRNKNVKIVLIEGPQDKIVCHKIKSSLAENEIVNFSSTNISKTCALLKRCNLLITHDTGTRHLAVAVETPVLALVPEDNLSFWNFYHYAKSYSFITGQRIIGERESQKNGFLSGIPVDDVCKKTFELLNL